MDQIIKTPRQFVQPGLGTTITREGGELKSLWIEIPAWCDLYCPYCFASTNKTDDSPDNLKYEEYRDIIEGFAKSGGKDIGIPGSGELFHPKNTKLVFQILDLCQKKNISLTLFTTGHWINKNIALRLLAYDVILLIKYNSRNREVQNMLVGNPLHIDYATKRDKALKILMDLGFNEPAFDKETRLGIVTSVMNANKNELPDLLRFARNNNLIFDCDTILERGRGKTFDEDGGSPPDEEMKHIFQELQKIDADEYNNHWNISRSYIGTCCDRFRHHLYISKTGDVHPCVGAVSVYLGNIKKESLQKCWDNPAMKIIRNHNYNGKCSSCQNNMDNICFSCLGRCTIHLDNKNILEKGCIETTGCWNYRAEKQDAK